MNLQVSRSTAVASLWVPLSHVIKQGSHHFSFFLEFMKLKHELDHYRGKHQEIFMKLFHKKRSDKARKIMVHPIRAFQFALQILEKGRHLICLNSRKVSFTTIRPPILTLTIFANTQQRSGER